MLRTLYIENVAVIQRATLPLEAGLNVLTIFDEPEAGIDLWSFGNLIDVFADLRRETEGSVLIISHQERILNIADEIVVLSGGSLTMHGPKDEILPGLLRGDRCAFCRGEE